MVVTFVLTIIGGAAAVGVLSAHGTYVYDGAHNNASTRSLAEPGPAPAGHPAGTRASPSTGTARSLAAFVVAPNTATQRIFRAVEPDELADLAGTGAFRTAPGLEGKYFWPTRGQADDFAAMARKADMGGPYCVPSGCIPANVLRRIESVPMDGLGPAYFIPEEYLPLIDDIVIHGG